MDGCTANVSISALACAIAKGKSQTKQPHFPHFLPSLETVWQPLPHLTI